MMHLCTHHACQIVQQKSAQAEVDAQRSQLRELSQAKKNLQNEVNNLQSRLQVAKNEASGETYWSRSSIIMVLIKHSKAAKRELQKRLQEEDLNASASSAATSGGCLIAVNNSRN